MLRITGLPSDESTASDTFKAIVKEKIGLELEQSDFSLSTIIPAPARQGTEGQPQRDCDVIRESPSTSATQMAPPVHQVTFSSPSVQQRCYLSRTKLKGTDIYLSEDLPVPEQELFYECRQLKKNNEIAATWTHRKKVFIRTLHHRRKQIQNLLDLEQII